MMARMPKARLERDGDVAELVIAAPPLNLFDATLIEEIEAAVAAVAAEPPRALLVRADGDVVSAGVDVHVFAGLDSAGADALTTRLLEITHAVEDLPFPTLFVAHGLCLTAAFELALACDLLWAGENVQFGLVEAVVGITPLMGGTQRVAERAGPARARELVMTGGLFGAETLDALGRGEPGPGRRGAPRDGAPVRRAAGRRADARARGDEGDRARAAEDRHAPRRRAHRRAHLPPVRH